MGKHGLSSCEKGVKRSPIREKDKATDDGIVKPKKSTKKTAKKKVDADVANDQASDQEVVDGDWPQPNG